MIAPSSLTVALPACFLRATGGALIVYAGIISLFRHLVKPLSCFFSGVRFFFYRVFYTHFLGIMCAI